MSKTPLIYGAPGLIYGAGLIYDKPFEPITTSQGGAAVAGPDQPRREAITLKFYSESGVLLGVAGSNVGFNLVSRCRWELTESGPGRLDLDMLDLPPGLVAWSHGMRADVLLWNDKEPYWSGTLERIPGRSNNNTIHRLRGMGYQAHIDRWFIEDREHTEQAVWEIVDQIARELEANTGIRYNGSKIVVDAGSLYTPSLVKFRNIEARKALEQMAGLAGGFVFGVDHLREFFFRPASPDCDDRILLVGYDLDEWEPTEDSSKVKNRYYIRHGQINNDYTSPAYKTNFLEVPIEDPPSQLEHGLRIGVTSAPSLYAVIDAYRYAANTLERTKAPEVSGTSPSIIFRGTRFEPGACYKIVAPEGSTELAATRITYETKGDVVEVRLQLGDEEDSLARWASDLVQTAAKDELERQISQQQLDLA